MEPISTTDPAYNFPEFFTSFQGLRFAMNAAGVGIWHLDPITKELFWDDRCRELFGFTTEGSRNNGIELQDALNCIHRDDLQNVLTAIQRALDGVDQGKYDEHYRTIGHNDKKLRWAHFSGQVYFDEAGKAVRFCGIALEETKYTIALKEASQVLDDAVELAKLATWSIDTHTGEAVYSQRMQNWLGTAENHQPLNTVVDFIPETDRERVKAAIKWVMKTESGGVLDLEYGIINAQTGRHRMIRVQGRTYFDAEGKALKVIGTAIDVTQQRNVRLALEHEVQQRTEELNAANFELVAANEELARVNQELKQSNDNLQQFAHVASHDLKEPARKIKTFLGMVAADPENKLTVNSRLFIERVSSAADRMLSMIGGVLTYATVNATGLKVEQVDLAGTIEKVEEDLELLIIEKKADISYENLPVIEGAPVLMYQLFSNLLMNALKFSKEGVSPVIRVTGTKVDMELDDFVRITVTDNGVGFEPQQSELIFNVFSRLHSKEKYEGTGLGLSLCRKIVQRHKGTIHATGHAGQGSMFTIILPLRQTTTII